MLSSNIILTAAHCSALIRVDDAYIVLGDRSKIEKENREQIFDLADFGVGSPKIPRGVLEG